MHDLESFEIGMQVEANFKGRGEWLLGSVQNIKPTSQKRPQLYDIKYDNGIVEINVDASFLRHRQFKGARNDTQRYCMISKI